MGIKGWICPKCGNVYAPFVEECFKCNPIESPDITCYINQGNGKFTDNELTDDEMLYCMDCGEFYAKNKFHYCRDNNKTSSGNVDW